MCYENIEKSLANLILKDRCPQSFIFYGKNLSERERVSKDFALKITGIKSNNFKDIFEFRSDKKIISVDDIRMLNTELLKKPEVSDNKVILIYDADKMTSNAQNSFLKSLEDLLENVFIILIVNDIKNMIDTVLSRCLLVKFSKLSILEYEKSLQKYDLDKEKLKVLYLQTKGDIDITRSVLEKEHVYKIYLHIIKLFEYLSKNCLMDIFEFGSEINNYKDYIEFFLETILEVIRDVFIYRETNNEDLIYSSYFKNCIIKISQGIPVYKIYNILEEIREFRNRINSNLNVEICYKIFILKVLEG